MLHIELSKEQIEEWVARHFEYKSRKGGEELLIKSPFTSDDKFKFNICTIPVKSQKTGATGYFVHDWRPTEQEHNTTFIKFVQKYKGLTFKEALKDILGDGINFRTILNKSYKKPVEETKTEILIQLPSDAIPITEEKSPTLKEYCLNYLKSRCITYEDAKAYKLYYNSSMIIFPYFEYEIIVYWQGRTIIGKRFEFPDVRETGIGKSHYLYGFDNAAPYEPIYITESIFGALSLGPGGLASGGAQMQNHQIIKIKALNPQYVVLAPDNDKEGIRSLRLNYNLISPYYKIKYCLPPDGVKDWNELDQKNGIGSARKYLLNNIKDLTLLSLMQLTIKK